MSFVFFGLLIGTFALILFALVISFFPEYFFITQVLLFISVIGMAGIFLCVMMLQPVLPYLDAKLKNGMLLIINQVNDNIVMVVPSKKATTLDTGDRFGTFIGSPNAVRSFIGFKKEKDLLKDYEERECASSESLLDRIDKKAKSRTLGGIKAYLLYEENAVPPETDLVRLCKRLEDTNIKDISSLRQSLSEKVSPIVFKDLDLKSITRYFDYVNPHYLNVRVERTAARLSKQYQQSWQKILPWISIMVVLMLFGAVAYAIIISATSSNAVPTPPGATILT